jgi:outer membrane lipoprotein-sorting protein
MPPFPHAEEPIEPLRQLARIEPRPEAARAAIERTRAAILRDVAGVAPATPAQEPIPRRRTVMLLKTAAAILALVGLTSLSPWLWPGAGARQALATVQDRLNESPSVSYTATTRIAGHPEITRRVWILGSDRVRVEGPQEEVLILDLKRGETLHLLPRQRQAVLLTGTPAPQAALGLYQTLRQADRQSARALPDRIVNGRRARGLVVDQAGGELHVWVDAETGLPVLGESSGMEGGQAARTTCTDFVFDRELDRGLFATTPPAGYAVERRTLATPGGESPETGGAAMVLTPGVGLGPVRFGATRAEVIHALGAPDAVEPSGAGGELLRYDSRGFWARVDRHGRFVEVACHAHPESAAPVARTFRGRTAAGVRLGDGADTVTKAYGPPDAESTTRRSKAGHDLETMTYWQERLSVSLRDGAIVEISTWSTED